MYAIISNESGVLGRFNDERSAVQTAQDWAILRGESLYVYFKNNLFEEIICD
jgi:hypothetical protein